MERLVVMDHVFRTAMNEDGHGQVALASTVAVVIVAIASGDAVCVHVRGAGMVMAMMCVPESNFARPFPGKRLSTPVSQPHWRRDATAILQDRIAG